MKITVLGKSHMEGTSKKTGKPYNLNQVHYLGKSRNVEGQAALTLFLDAIEYPYDSIKIGRTYDAEFDQYGYIVEFVELPSDSGDWEQ